MSASEASSPRAAAAEDQQVDVIVIGGGLAGLAAARRISVEGRSVAVIAESPGSLPYTSGALDLLSVYPTETKRVRTHPWEAVSELIEREPEHPYGRVGLGGVQRAWDDFLSYLSSGPLRYGNRGDENQSIVTVAGTLKPTFAVPATLMAGAEAWAQKRPTLIVGFDGLTDFSPEQVVGNLRPRWSGLRALRLPRASLPRPDQRLTVPMLAAELAEPAFRETLCEIIEPELESARFVGLPSVLGFDQATEICDDLAVRLGVAVFEIPLLSPCYPGMRLAELLKRDLWTAGVHIWQGAPASRLEDDGSRLVAAWRQGRSKPQRIEAAAVVLATGRFFGGGLEATPHGVRECLLDLPVDVPYCRDDWHMGTFLGAPGHPINRVGVAVDHELRPVDRDGRPGYHNLFAAGALLAHHDWVREKSGAGISIATGHAAAERALAVL